MASCKDCIHYVVCDRCPQNDCEVYAPKSRYIELPCAVGDDIYWVYYKRGEIKHYKVRSINIVVLNKNYRSITLQFEEPNGHREFDYQFNSDRFGEVVFLTKEEALKALERSEGK